MQAGNSYLSAINMYSQRETYNNTRRRFHIIHIIIGTRLENKRISISGLRTKTNYIKTVYRVIRISCNSGFLIQNKQTTKKIIERIFFETG